MAHGDLAVADLVLANPIGVNWAACFHAQQAAEKSLKALLVATGVDFPHTHQLERLADLLPTDLGGLLDRQALIRLSPWAVAGRYPEDIATPSTESATALVSAARAVATEVARLLGDP
jgi:HEPN domain-containing protein